MTIEVVKGHPSRTIDGTPEGKEYITLTSYGIKREGEEHSAYYKSSELALSELNNRLEKYFIGKSKVYWRQEPKTQGTEAFFPSVWESKTSRPEVDLKKVPLYIATCRVYAE